MKALVLEAAARAAHEAERAFSIAFGEQYTPHWEQLPEADQQALLSTVRRVAEGWAAREIHEAWVSDRTRAGWRPGPRDVMSRTRPELVPYDALAPVERDRCVLQCSVASAVLSAFPLKSRVW